MLFEHAVWLNLKEKNNECTVFSSSMSGWTKISEIWKAAFLFLTYFDWNFLNLLVVHNVIWKSSISNQEQKRQCLYHHEENKRRAVWFLKLWVEGCVAESKGPDSRYINIKMFRDSFLCSDTTPPPPNLRWNIVAIWVSSCLKIEHSFQLLNCSWHFTDQEERWKWSCLKKKVLFILTDQGKR